MSHHHADVSWAEPLVRVSADAHESAASTASFTRGPVGEASDGALIERSHDGCSVDTPFSSELHHQEHGSGLSKSNALLQSQIPVSNPRELSAMDRSQLLSFGKEFVVQDAVPEEDAPSLASLDDLEVYDLNEKSIRFDLRMLSRLQAKSSPASSPTIGSGVGIQNSSLIMMNTPSSKTKAGVDKENMPATRIPVPTRMLELKKNAISSQPSTTAGNSPSVPTPSAKASAQELLKQLSRAKNQITKEKESDTMQAGDSRRFSLDRALPAAQTPVMSKTSDKVWNSTGNMKQKARFPKTPRQSHMSMADLLADVKTTIESMRTPKSERQLINLDIDNTLRKTQEQFAKRERLFREVEDMTSQATAAQNELDHLRVSLEEKVQGEEQMRLEVEKMRHEVNRLQVELQSKEVQVKPTSSNTAHPVSKPSQTDVEIEKRVFGIVPRKHQWTFLILLVLVLELVLVAVIFAKYRTYISTLENALLFNTEPFEYFMDEILGAQRSPASIFSWLASFSNLFEDVPTEDVPFPANFIPS